jgi:hypothetical protein
MNFSSEEPPGHGHTSLPIATEKGRANLTNPAKEKQSSLESPLPPLTELEGQNTPTTTVGGSAEAAATAEEA